MTDATRSRVRRDLVLGWTSFAEHRCVRAPGMPLRACAPLWTALSRAEREHCAAGLPRLDRYAGRVAAKRAVHALLERAGAIDLTDVTIVSDEHGRPHVEFSSNATRVARFAALDDVDVELSISHRANRAVAVAAPASVDIGIDLIDRHTIAENVALYGTRLAHRVLTETERETSDYRAAPAEVVAEYIAAKEAAGKILKRDRPDISWLDVEIHDPDAPVPDALRAMARELALELGFASPRFARARAGLDARDPWLLSCRRGGWTCALALRSHDA